MESKDFDHPVYEHPDTGKVLNPITENFITKNYASQIGVLSEAKEKTAQYFRDIDEKASEAAEAAEEKILNSSDDDEAEVISAEDDVEEDKEVLEETDRVEYDESGQEKRVSHGDTATDQTPDEALESIMSDLDDEGDDFDGEDFVDTDAAPDQDMPVSPSDNPVPSGADESQTEEWSPENMDMPTFPGGVYSTKSRQEKKKKEKMKKMNEGKDPRNRSDTQQAGGPNKRYEHTDSGGIRVIYNDDDDNDDE